MIKKVQAILMGLWSATMSCWATIPQEIDSPTLLADYLKDQKLTEGDLVIFDVDMVLTIPQAPYFQLPTLKLYRQEFQEFMQKLSIPEKDLAVTYMIIDSSQVPSSQELVSLVQNLQSQKIPVIALTAFLTGSFSLISNAGQWRIFSLGLAGYDFIGTYPLVPTQTFTDFPKYLGAYPFYSQGVLVSNGPYGGTPKGEVLSAFLKPLDYQPKRIIMVDDRLSHLTEIGDTLQKYHPKIVYLPIHYTATSQGEAPPVSKAEFLKKLAEIKANIDQNAALLKQ